ncbi:MAG TPA: hypothetical protein VKQ36_17560 [Ktedonobacterales bacterium]|nr:hypothetical protein [Ktedonobacterales bacterium]
MSTRTSYILTALCGILGTSLLAVYFLAAPPLPPANATVAQVTSVAMQYHDTWYLGAWFQAMGSLLSIIFFLALVHLAGGATKFAGTLTLLGSAILLAVTLVEGAFTIDFAQAAANGHGVTSLTSYDIMSVFIHIFPLAPAPMIFLPLGVILLGSRLLPRVFAYLALAIGVVFVIVGFAGLLTTPILTLIPLGCQALWTLAASVTLAFRKPASVVGAQVS